MASIQNGEAQILTYTDGPMLAFRYENAITLVLQSLEKDSWFAYSEGGLQFESQRMKLSQDSSQTNVPLILNFSEPRSGTLYFASVNPTDTSRVVMWQL